MDFELLLFEALEALIEKCGGNIEEALDLIMCGKKEEEREEIKKWYGWEEEEK